MDKHLDGKWTPEPNTGCYLWFGARSGFGYGSFTRGGKKFDAHRYAFEQAYGPISAGLWVLHRCDVPECVNPEHLFLGTHGDNMADMTRKGRHGTGGAAPTGVRNGMVTHPERHRYRLYHETVPVGEDAGNARLTAAQVAEIRQRKPAGSKFPTYRQLGREYGVTGETISNIVRGKNWRH